MIPLPLNGLSGETTHQARLNGSKDSLVAGIGHQRTGIHPLKEISALEAGRMWSYLWNIILISFDSTQLLLTVTGVLLLWGFGKNYCLWGGICKVAMPLYL